MSKKLRYPTSGVLLAGCLLVTTAQAQVAPITPTTETAASASTPVEAPVPQQVAPPIKSFSTMGFDLEFNDITVKELLKTLGRQFGINISVANNVDGIISYINLTNSTPIEALKTVVETAGDLSFRQMSNGNYIVSKSQPGDLMGGTENSMGSGYLPGQNQVPPTSQQNGLSAGSLFDLDGPIGGTNAAPYTAPQGFSRQGTQTTNALPQLGGSSLLDKLPELANFDSRNGKIRQKAIRIRNAPSSFIAYQLDPGNNPIPIQIQQSRSSAAKYGNNSNAANALGESNVSSPFGSNSFNQGDFAQDRINPYLRNSASSLVRPETRTNYQFGNNNGGGNNRGGGNNNLGGGNNGGGGSFTLPDGIEQIVSVDPQNVLLVAYEDGNDEAVRQLQELIDVLDQPLRQVEIEAQFVELQSQDASAFGIDFSTSRGNFDAATTGFASAPVQGAFQVGFVRGNFSARLNALIADNRAKLITAPRVTAINNLTAQLTSQERRPLILTSVSQNIGGGQQGAQQLLFIDTTTGLSVTPTINGDDTITVLMEPQVSSQAGNNGLQTITTRTVRTVANVRDGDTIALGGLRVVNNTVQNNKIPLLGDIPFIGKLFRSQTTSENESELIIFVTARIIRRAGDDIGLIVPGT